MEFIDGNTCVFPIASPLGTCDRLFRGMCGLSAALSGAIDERRGALCILDANDRATVLVSGLACDELEACVEPDRPYLCKCKQILYSPDDLYKERSLFSLVESGPFFLAP